MTEVNFMKPIINLYLIFTCMYLAIMWAKVIYYSYKLHAYVSKNDPDRARTIGIPNEGPYNGFKFLNYISSKEIDGLDYIESKLKSLARSSFRNLLICMLVTPLGLILLLFLFG